MKGGCILHTIQMIDESILLWIQNNLRIEFLSPIVKLFTFLGNAGMIWIVLSLLMIFWKPTRRAGLLGGLALFFSLIFTNFTLKLFFARSRPYLVIGELIPLITSMDPNSFPSGHTSAAFSAGIVWSKTLSNPWIRIGAVVQAVFMGLSRLYVGVHYPSDVLVGALVGIIYALLSLSIGCFFQNRARNFLEF